MNRKVLQKVIDALNQPNPDLSYIKGILETVIETLPEEKVTIKTPAVAISGIINNASLDEAEQMELMAKAKLDSIKTIAGQQI